MIQCKQCKGEEIVKNGSARGLQRYKCKICGFNFVLGDARKKPSTAVKKALCVLFYSLGKASFSMLGKILGHSPSIVYRWIVEAMNASSEPLVRSEIKEMEFDEMWHFIGSKKTKNGSSKRWIVARGELWPGLSAVVILQPSKDSMIK